MLLRRHRKTREGKQTTSTHAVPEAVGFDLATARKPALQARAVELGLSDEGKVPELRERIGAYLAELDELAALSDEDRAAVAEYAAASEQTPPDPATEEPGNIDPPEAMPDGEDAPEQHEGDDPASDAEVEAAKDAQKPAEDDSK